ncbi:sulfiredoxin [Prunus dulcis]|uniref:sulfiredoxin n=1 Tax=Prunus dulcis TaxID=3755 RepID=A0A4Y1RAW1_PRUDU|nr:sulfiredoxin [Prunus dulcis]
MVTNNLRSFTVSASVSSNGSPPLSSSGGSGGVGGPVILELPLDKIRRPLMRTRANDPIKVQELMDSISEIGLQTPIDVLEVEGASPVVIVMKLTSVLAFQQYAAKSGVEQKKLSGITSADFLWLSFRVNSHSVSVARIGWKGTSSQILGPFGSASRTVKSSF